MDWINESWVLNLSQHDWVALRIDFTMHESLQIFVTCRYYKHID